MSKIDIKKKAEERKIVEKIFNPLKFSIEDNEPLDFLISVIINLVLKSLDYIIMTVLVD